MAGVTFDHVYKRWGDFIAINDLTLEVPDQEFLVLVGPSGSGKSTALRLLAGLDEITGGRILIGEREVNNLPARERDIAMVFQSYALYPHMSVFDNMAFGLTLRKTPRDEIRRRVNDAAAILGIETLLDRKPRALSGGQRQRVALGRAIVRDPAVFLFDEPLSNLDAKLRVQTRAEISKLHQRLGTTFIYVTHDQVEAMTMATRIAVLNFGELQQVGTPRELYETPRNVFVAGFIGSPAMNFFDAKVVDKDGELCLDAAKFEVPAPPTLQGPLRSYLGKTVTAGIRPENIDNAEFRHPEVRSAILESTVDVTEMMGNEIIAYLEIGGQTFLARLDPRTTAIAGQSLSVALEVDRLHLFDPETQLAISAASPATPAAS